MAKQKTNFYSNLEDYNKILWGVVKLLGLSSLVILLIAFLIGVIIGVIG
jgi:TM2 domain-containing membrane protein YozV